MKEIVLRLDIHDDKSKKKAMKAVSTLKGVDSISMDMKEKKLTVTGDNVDPVAVVNKLRKPWCKLNILRKLGYAWHTEIIKIAEKKKDEPKKDEAKKDDDKNKAEAFNPYKAYPYMTPVYHVQSVPENPNACACVIS